ncbi:hypothetical protein C3432_02235 [Citrobacter amalonaticus]|uniref:Uncharacterized protein n=1 Tax=Citrobacter amalonaticus TaxID=35703 RepID=A0A2S4S4B8_CITAM|nr:hypothetical protein C3432_02235 [Citrobacter amalonaticus]POT78337.1 hypothetical protein C3436_09905 [Citrobacter amalonaticus]POU68727.1 hypothetical protein C3430_03440 [Citrobacter amalonaticus]POV08331.1 hypothetical protein C3424_03450 [Citrobacter amalonaticus]
MGGCGEKRTASAAEAEERVKANKEAAINRRRFNSVSSGVLNRGSFYGNPDKRTGINCKEM